ncbi:MAG TPA: hypothetical protein VIB59_02080 [Solirubrobacteraceae bacterium]
MRERLWARSPLSWLRAAALLALVALGAGCGAGSASGRDADAAAAPHSCPETVMATLASVVRRVYAQGVQSERTASAEAMIERSKGLRVAIEAGNPKAARRAARGLIATGHMTNLIVTTTAGRALVSLGGPALTPLRGTIRGAAGRPIATYTTSVWADSGIIAEGAGISEGQVALRAGEHSIGGSVELPPGALGDHGTLDWHGASYQYASLPGRTYPAGDPIKIYLLKTVAAAEQLCGAGGEDTQVNVLERIANRIYEAERGPHTLPQIRRVQHNQPLLRAVANRDRVATRRASEALLHHHLVRLRVSAGGKLLDDLGGPFVLAPVGAELRLHGRRIGSFVLSIQDDEGYLRLTRRLVGLKVLMYMRGPDGRPRLVKNSLGPGVDRLASVPASGSYSYRGGRYRVFTVDAEAFPSGPLTIRVLVPTPYA